MILKYTKIDTGQRIALHFLLCSTTFLTESNISTAHFAAPRSFLVYYNSIKLIIELPPSVDPKLFTVIGIIGPTVGRHAASWKETEKAL